MRIERWYWLFVFCLVSLGIHVGLALHSNTFGDGKAPARPAEIEVTLEAPPEPPPPKPEPTSKPKPPTTPPPKHALLPIAGIRPLTQPKAIVVKNLSPAPSKAEKAPDERPAVPKPTQFDGTDPNKEDLPQPIGLPVGKTEAPRMARLTKPDPLSGGGGAPAPGPIPGGHDGAKGPEAPPEDIVYNGGGAGGEKLPKVAPKIGGGGGASILSVDTDNPLASAVKEEKPGLGPGVGSGEGIGKGGGVGYGSGKGIGTQLDGKDALGSLHRKPGSGIGAGKGDKIGTRAPGGGRGTGSELPGTGGSGLGYGRGSGIGIGNGSGAGVGNGRGGGPGLSRGIPFGDITGLLGGDRNGGKSGGGTGGIGRGSVFGAHTGGGGQGPLHIVYCLDCSGSMREADKIGKAKEALKKALSELKPGDSYNIIPFNHNVYQLYPEMLPVKPDLIEQTYAYIDSLRLGNGTNISGALDAALNMEGVTHIFLMTDGEPSGDRFMDFDELRLHVRDTNVKKVRILTLALLIGENNYKGRPLLQGIAKDNNGDYNEVDLR